MNRQQAELYLERIGLDKSLVDHAPDAQLLSTLQYAHVTTVPYENLDILNNIPLKLDEESLFEKIVLNRRGGYCFELNALYCRLLEALGYKTLSCFARYLRGETELPMRRHRIIIVESPDLDGRYFTDTGIGERAPRLALKLEEGFTQEQFGEIYRFEKDDFLGWVLCDHYKGEWGRFISFTEEPQLEADYIGTSFYCEKHPDSPFILGNMLSIKTQTGRKTVSSDEFRIFDGQNVTAITVTSDEEMKEIFSTHFSIVL